MISPVDTDNPESTDACCDVAFVLYFAISVDESAYVMISGLGDVMQSVKELPACHEPSQTISIIRRSVC